MAKIQIELPGGVEAGNTINELTKRASLLNKELRGLGVGTQEYADKAAELNKVSNSLGEIRKQTKAVGDASDLLKKAWSNLPGAQYFNQITDSLGMAKSGVGGLISNFGVLKTALAATGFGLLVVVVGSLIAAFTKFTPLVDKVEQVFGGLNGILDVVINRIINFGKGLVDIASGNWSAGVDKISSSFKDLGGAMSAAYDAGSALKKLQQDLEDSARGVDIANARAEASVNRLIVASKNKSLSDTEQINILKQARKIAEDNFKLNDAQREGEFEALIKEAQLKSKLSKDEILQLTEGTLAYEIEYEKRGTIEDTLLDKIKDAQIQRINAEGQTGKLLEKIQNAEDMNRQQRDAANQKATDAKKKKDEDDVKEKQRLADEKKKIYDKELADLAEDVKRQVAAVEQGEEDTKKAAAFAEKVREGIQETNLAKEQNELTRALVNKEITFKQYQESEFQILLTYQKKRLDAARNNFGVESKEYQREYAAYLKIQKDAGEAAQKNYDDQQKDQSERLKRTLQVFGTITGEMASLFQQGTEEWKAFAVAQTIISTIQGAQAAFKSGSEINPILGFVAAAAATAAGLARVAQIENTKVPTPTAKGPKFALGGIPDGVLQGPSHVEGGIPLVAEGQEIILTKGVFKNPDLRSMASAINVAGGGKQFAPINPSSLSRGIGTGLESGTGLNSGATHERLQSIENRFVEFSTKIDKWATSLEANVNLQNVKRGLTTLENLRDKANV